MIIYAVEEVSIKPRLPYTKAPSFPPRAFLFFKDELEGKSVYEAEGYSLTAAQHLGSYAGMEDNYLAEIFTITDKLSLDDWLDIISETFKAFYEEIYQKQKTGDLLYSGATFSGCLVLNDFFITIQLGDGGIFALQKGANNQHKCFPLERVHQLDHSDEMTRVLSQWISDDEILQIQEVFKSFGQNAFRVLSDDWKSDFKRCVRAIYSKQVFAPPKNPTLAKIIEAIQNLVLQPDHSNHFLSAICSYLTKSIFFWKPDGDYTRLSPTRVFGDHEVFDLTGIPYCGPELRIYHLPAETTSLVVTSDGVTDALSVKEIALVADNNHGPNNFIERLLYQSYIANEEFCDNITAFNLEIAKGALKNDVLFCGVFDGHGGQHCSNSPQHVHHYIYQHLPDRLWDKIQMKIEQNKKLHQANTERPLTVNWSVMAEQLGHIHQAHIVKCSHHFK